MNWTARSAGLFYLLLVISGIFALIYVPSKLIVWEDAALTTENIRQSVLLYKWGVIGEMICYLMFILLVFQLHRLFAPVHKFQANLMAVFVLVSIPISFLNLANNFAVMTLVGEADYVRSLGEPMIQSHVMLFSKIHESGVLVAQVFWGLWLFPFGYLVYKSGFLPRILGVLLMVGCFTYLIEFFGAFFFAGYYDTLFSNLVGIPAFLGEIGICLWLLIAGVRKTAVAANT